MIFYVSNQKRLNTSDKIQEAKIQDCIDYCQNIDEIGLDTETEGFDPYTNSLLSIQLGDFNNQFVIDCKTIDINILVELFKSKNKLFLFHNAKFDLKFLYHYGIDVQNVYDTFLTECILTTGYANEERQLALDAVTIKYCGVKLDKSIRGTIHREGLTDRVIIYGADDVKYLPSIKAAQLPQIKQYSLENVLELENNVVKVFARMEYNGAPLNKDKWLQVTEQVEKNTQELEKQLDTLIYTEGTKSLPQINSLTKYCNIYKQGSLFFDIQERDCNINWASPAQKLKLLKDLGIKIDSVGDRELQKNKTKHAVVPLLINYSKQNKLATSFGRDFLEYVNPKTNRVHGNIWQILSTGRISISEPNINQIPSHGELATKIRASFEAPKGYKIVGGDYSGMELRIIAQFSQDPLWLKVFNEGGDLHSELCAATFKIPLSDVKKPFPPKPEFKYRDVQKTVNFGLSYGMSKYKLADTLQISVEEAEEIINQFFSVVPKVKSFLEGLRDLGKRRGYIRTGKPFSRIRWFPKWDNARETQSFSVLEEIGRASMNTPIQGSNADVIKQAMINIQNRIDGENWPVQIVMQVYDELQTICREDRAEEWREVLEFEMKKAAQIIITSIPVEVDCKISDYWEK